MAASPEVSEVYTQTQGVGQIATFIPGDQVGQIGCHECGGTGWWGYGPTENESGPCVVCKGTGREWVSLL